MRFNVHNIVQKKLDLINSAMVLSTEYPYHPHTLPSHTTQSKICSFVLKIKIILYRIYTQAARKKEFVLNTFDRIPKHLAH